METLESSRMCRLCGQHSGICINIFDKSENHVKKINAVLPILVHEMDLLPKQMCHRCSYKLEEFHKFYSDCLKTDMDLKSQLSWMRKRDVEERIRVPMVQIENVKIKSEPPDYDIYELDPIVENVNYISSMSSMTFSMNDVRNKSVDSSRLSEVDQRFKCDNTFANCASCKCNYGKNNAKPETALSINCTNIKSVSDVGIGSSSTSLGSSSRLNAFKNRPGSDRSKLMRKSKQRFSNEINTPNVGNMLNTNEVKEIKIKTEKPDDIEARVLRPRNKSIDYLGTKRKKSNLILNPASLSKTGGAKRKSAGNLIANPIVNGIAVDRIKKEPLEETQSRILRPRKFLIDYRGSKRKDLSCSRINAENESKSKEVRTKRYKSANDSKATSSLLSGKPLTSLFTETVDFKVKEEIVSDEETPNIEQGNETGRCVMVDRCVRNLSNLFDGENKLVIKLEENIEDGLTNRDKKTAVVGSKSSRGVKSLTKIANKLKQRNIAVKRTSSTNCSPKYLRSQDLRLRNGKVKKSESIHRLTIPSLRKILPQLSKTGRGAIGRNLSEKMKNNLNVINVPTSLKTANNIKHFCEKCCTSFMNKELYMLHACYFE